MIIRAGMNIYPAEIENVLSTDSRVCEVQVYGYEKNGTQEIGMAISGDFYSTEEVMDICRHYLPKYQIPSKIELVESLEKTRRKKEKESGVMVFDEYEMKYMISQKAYEKLIKS